MKSTLKTFNTSIQVGCLWAGLFCKRMIEAMKSSARLMEWLNKPQKHGKPDDEWIVGQVKVFGDEWR